MVVLALVLLLPIPVAATEVMVSIYALSEAAHCTKFVAKVYISEVTNFDAYVFDLTYDTTVLQVIGAEGGLEGVTDGLIHGTTIPVVMWGYSPPGTPGTVTVVGNVPTIPGVNGMGYLCEIHFHVVGEPCNTYALTLSNGHLFDRWAEEITPVTWEGD